MFICGNYYYFDEKTLEYLNGDLKYIFNVKKKKKK